MNQCRLKTQPKLGCFSAFCVSLNCLNAKEILQLDHVLELWAFQVFTAVNEAAGRGECTVALRTFPGIDFIVMT